ncbi:unnamed protein product [Cuscuta campestris]|uniref:CCHC-type domain-containing protein n=1 Tax=Cuscuta campestris TaxID=132261 RepID=A0A484NSC7_9ASTE|nr:unnamed protein product [Cuscuta campestris]
MWDKLEITYEGTDQVREAKIDFLTHEYELFRMKENEKIDEMFERFSKIVNDLHALKKTYTDKELVRKILRSLTPEWRSKADAIQESIGVTNVTIDGLRGNLKTYESTILFPSLGEQKKKGIALKASSSQEPAMVESSDEDNEFGLVIKKFHKFMRKEYERKGKKHGGPPKCYGCGEVGHIKPKCPNAKNEKEKKPFKKHRAYISWGGDSGDESSEGRLFPCCKLEGSSLFLREKSWSAVSPSKGVEARVTRVLKLYRGESLVTHSLLRLSRFKRDSSQWIDGDGGAPVAAALTPAPAAAHSSSQKNPERRNATEHSWAWMAKSAVPGRKVDCCEADGLTLIRATSTSTPASTLSAVAASVLTAVGAPSRAAAGLPPLAFAGCVVAAATAGAKEGSVRPRVGEGVGLLLFHQEEGRTNFQERRERILILQEVHLAPNVLGQALKDLENESMFGYRSIHIVKVVRQIFEEMTIVVDGPISLDSCLETVLQLHCTSMFVVMEEFVNQRPKGMSGWTVGEDEI